jgi:hypothetical protein
MNVDELISRLTELSTAGLGDLDVWTRGATVIDAAPGHDGTVYLMTSTWLPRLVDAPTPDDEPESGDPITADPAGNVISFGERRVAPVMAVAEPGDFVIMEVTRTTDAGFATFWVPGIVHHTDGAGLMTMARVFDPCQDEWTLTAPISQVFIMAAGLIDVDRACRQLAPAEDRLTIAAAAAAFLTNDGRAAVARRMSNP